MSNKNNFRIKRSARMDELIGKNPLLQKTLQKIVGGRSNQAGTAIYGRVVGLIENQQEA